MKCLGRWGSPNFDVFVNAKGLQDMLPCDAHTIHGVVERKGHIYGTTNLQSPCKIGLSNPPMAANSGKIYGRYVFKGRVDPTNAKEHLHAKDSCRHYSV
jgi:hypothetical protein